MLDLYRYENSLSIKPKSHLYIDTPRFAEKW